MSKKHGKTTFQENWLLDPELKTWLKKVDDDVYSASCRFCPAAVIQLASMGRQALTSHMRGTKHKAKVEAFQQSPGLNTFFRRPVTTNAQTSSPSVAVSSACIDPPATVSTASTSSELSPVVLDSSTAVQVQPKGLKKFLLNENVTKAEILWCMETVFTHQTMRAAGRDVNIFKLMFPDSEIASKMELQRTKIAYTIIYGLAPHFNKKLVDKVTNCECFVVAFDESLNKVSQRQQIDLVVRFWDAGEGLVCTRYLTSAFLTKSAACDLLEAFLSSIKPLSRQKLLQVSMDGPNVNVAFFRELKATLKEDDNNSTTLLDFGSCGLHVVHNAFKKAMIVTKWEIVAFLRALYNLFKDTPARRGFYTLETGSKVFPLKFCAVRWLENANVAQRAMEMLPHIKKYVASAEREKKVPTSTSYTTVAKGLNDPLLGPKLAFFKTLANEAEPFLKDFQTNWPMVPLLHSALSSLICSVMERFVKPTKISATVDLNNVDNLLHSNKVNIGFSTSAEIRKCSLADSQIKQLRKDCKSALKAFVQKILERSPLKYKISELFTCFDPLIAAENVGKQLLDKLLLSLIEHGWVSGSCADKVAAQYSRACSSTLGKETLLQFDRKKTRLDEFWMTFLKEEHHELRRVVKMILVLSHGNAEVERGFSVNKECLVTNMAEETLVGFRTVYDEIQKSGGVDQVEITKSLVHAARNARSRYGEEVEKRKRENQIEEEERLSLKRKNQMIQELEAKKAKLMESVRDEASSIDREINSLLRK